MSRSLSRLGVRINKQIGRAIKDHQLVEQGDRILVAVSGGKDSLTLLHFLSMIKTWAPIRFELTAINVKTDFFCASCVHEDYLTKLCGQLSVECVHRRIKVLDENRSTDCFWCSWNRRKALFTAAQELGCNKLALGHHKDDFAETILMNLAYNGKFAGILPRQEMFGGKLTMIRPLCYVEETLTRSYAEEMQFVVKDCRCPFGKNSKRKYIKDFIERTQASTPGINIRSNLYGAMARYRGDPGSGEAVALPDLAGVIEG